MSDELAQIIGLVLCYTTHPVISIRPDSTILSLTYFRLAQAYVRTRQYYQRKNMVYSQSLAFDAQPQEIKAYAPR